MRYARVTVDGGKTVTLLVTRDSKDWLSGYEVDRDGVRLARNGAQQLHVIQRTAIVKLTPLRVSLTYGTLEKSK